MIDRYILLAEDNPNDAELTIAALKESKMVSPIIVVPDGAEALDFLYRRGRHAGRSNGPPALILLDLKMPKVDGLEVLTTIKDLAGEGLTMLIVTHQMGFAREIADKVIFMDQGRFIFEGCADDCFSEEMDHPRIKAFLRKII